VDRFAINWSMLTGYHMEAVTWQRMVLLQNSRPVTEVCMHSSQRKTMKVTIGRLAHHIAPA
jgi:hypothetical protein